MADNKTLNALVIELDGPISSIKELKQQIETLSVSLAKAGEDSAGYAQGMDLLKKRQDELAKATSLAKAQNMATKDTYYSLNKALSDARKEYKNLTAEQRNNAEQGGKLLKTIKGLDDQLKSLDAKMGMHQRSVGDYTESIKKAFDGVGLSSVGLGKAIKGLDVSFRVFSTNPVMAVFTLLLPLISKIVEKVKGTAAATEGLKNIMASLQPIMDITTIVVEKLAKGFEWLAKKVSGLVDKLFKNSKESLHIAATKASEATDKMKQSQEDAAKAVATHKEKVDELTESLQKLREEISEDMAIRAEDEAFQKQADADYLAREKEREAADKARLERQEKEMAIRKKLREEDEKNEEELENQRRTREELAAKRKKQAQQEYVDLVAGLMGSLADIYEANGEADARYAKRAKALRIASATIQTVNGAISAYMNTIDTYKNPAIAIPLGIANAATVTAAGLANIAKMKSTDVSGTGTAVATPAATTSAAVTPNVPQVAIATSASQQAAINQPVKAYIVADDLEGARLKAQQTEQETSF